MTNEEPTDEEPTDEEPTTASIVQNVLEDRKHDSDTTQGRDSTISLGHGIFLVGACGAVGWLAGYTTIVYWAVDPWLVGPALALFLGGVAGLVITTLTTNRSSDTGSTNDD